MSEASDSIWSFVTASAASASSCVALLTTVGVSSDVVSGAGEGTCGEIGLGSNLFSLARVSISSSVTEP